ncbi:hypothetical protein PRZ48_008296 [Zasmidium cellare]|uniref:O-methyltransferase C-terminal domain-containing protein n=1 Tax=Zasmidium cellare TaxID=395010 RepID=A0ABR0EFP6_ZASCE|nr:hypothetical protein PRZ48_008296 [Zasmidium cellare]
MLVATVSDRSDLARSSPPDDLNMLQSSHSQEPLPTREDLHRLIGEINRFTRAFESLDDAQITALHKPDTDTRSDAPMGLTKCLASERYELQTACESLVRATKGAKRYLPMFAQSHRPISALQYVVHFRLGKYLPLDQSISFDELAALAGVPEEQCQRTIRMLVTNDIFHEPAVGYVAPNRYSTLLADEGMEAALGFLTEETFRAASCLAPAATHWNHSQERTKAPFNLAFNTVLPMFDFLSLEEPWRAERFRKTMAFFGGKGGSDLEHLVHGFGWTSLSPGTTVVDVGGSGGYCMRAVAAVNPGIKCIVQDIESGLGDYKSTDSFDGRITFAVHDFFSPQTCVADVYLLRWILHDYPDHAAARILRCQVSALKPGAKVLVMDSILPNPGEKTKAEEKDARLSDIGMWALLNGRERDLDAWTKLFSMADPRLKLVSAVTPEGSALAVMELQLGEQ